MLLSLCALRAGTARPFKNAAANRGRGGGYEDVSRYTRRVSTLAESQSEHGGPAGLTDSWTTTISFAGIENIHVVRNSLTELTGAQMLTWSLFCKAILYLPTLYYKRVELSVAQSYTARVWASSLEANGCQRWSRVAGSIISRVC